MINNISVIIPARNEEDNLKILIPSLLSKYKRNISEIIIIDDNSTDDTNITAKDLQTKYKIIQIISRKNNPGVGNAIRDGIKKLSIKSKYVLLMDCDFIANVNDIKYFLKEIKKYPGITGSRFMRKDSLENYPKLKFVANRIFHILGKYLLNISNSDLTNNFKLYKKELIDIIKPYLISHDFAINAEIGFYPVLLGINIRQVPVHWKERSKQMGLSKFKILKVGPSYFRIFLRLLMMKAGLTNITKAKILNKEIIPPM